MTEAGWTSKAPTKEGWYWMRAPKCGWRDCVVWVDKDEDGFYIDVGDCDSEYVMDIEAEWLGPITPDSYQQGRVAGLEAASRVAESFPWSRGGRLENPLHIGRREGEKAASEHIAAEIRKLAQQAQDDQLAKGEQ